MLMSGCDPDTASVLCNIKVWTHICYLMRQLRLLPCSTFPIGYGLFMTVTDKGPVVVLDELQGWIPMAERKHWEAFSVSWSDGSRNKIVSA
ncbi:hypothetical protein GDO81_021160 [Engystomops pustulosus]|uniref:Uncharacterized protein n=1 Tax=Engystomops pustulosus TaxID=76066 RepID=A0AAV6YQ29_ENGPU|nr:hypothetical protein GDO81_021160 [Engystomops pustulosus]